MSGATPGEDKQQDESASAVLDPEAAPSGAAAPGQALTPGDTFEQKVEAQLAQRNQAQLEAEERNLSALKLPVITKTAEVLAKHLRETFKKDPEVPANVLRTWIREEDGQN